MATKSEIEAQIRGLRKLLSSKGLPPKRYKFLEDQIFELEGEISHIDYIENQAAFRNKQFLKGVGNLILNILPSLKAMKALKGAKGEKGLPFGNIIEGEYEIEGSLSPTKQRLNDVERELNNLQKWEGTAEEQVKTGLLSLEEGSEAAKKLYLDIETLEDEAYELKKFLNTQLSDEPEWMPEENQFEPSPREQAKWEAENLRQKQLDERANRFLDAEETAQEEAYYKRIEGEPEGIMSMIGKTPMMGERIAHFTLPGNAVKILEEGYDATLPPVHGTGGLQGGPREGKAGGDILYFTTDEGRWSEATIYVGEGEGDISREVYDYDKQEWGEDKNAYKKVNLEKVEAVIKENARTLTIDSWKAAEDFGVEPQRHGFIEDMVNKAKAEGYDIVNLKNPEGTAWHSPTGRTDKYGEKDWYETLTGGGGKDDYFILNKEVVEMVAPEIKGTPSPPSGPPSPPSGGDGNGGPTREDVLKYINTLSLKEKLEVYLPGAELSNKEILQYEDLFDWDKDVVDWENIPDDYRSDPVKKEFPDNELVRAFLEKNQIQEKFEWDLVKDFNYRGKSQPYFEDVDLKKIRVRVPRQGTDYGSGAKYSQKTFTNPTYGEIKEWFAGLEKGHLGIEKPRSYQGGGLIMNYGDYGRSYT